MGIPAGTVYFDVRPNVEGLDRRIQNAIEPAAKKADKSLAQIGNRMTDVGKKASVRFTLPIVAGMGLAFDAASDLAESVSKVDVVFGDSAPEIQAWSKTTATAIGQSRRQALEAVGTFGNLFRAMEIGEKPAADMSKRIVTLSSDLASFNNADPTEVLDALRAGLVGETEPLRRFGVNINQARIEAKAFELGLAKPTVDLVKLQKAQLDASDAAKAYGEAVRKHGKDSIEAAKAQNKLDEATQNVEKALKGNKTELNAAQKAQATYALIMEDTVLAQGDFARTADGAANKSRILKAQMGDLAADLGNRLLPVGNRVISFASDMVRKFTELPPVMQNVALGAAGVIAAIGPISSAVGNVAKAVSGLSSVGAFLAANPWAGAAAAVAGVSAAAYLLIKRITSNADAMNRERIEASVLTDELNRQRTAREKLAGLELSLKDARLRVKETALAVKEAEARLKDIRNDSKRDAGSLRRAELDLERARLSHEQAARDAADAERELKQTELDRLAAIRTEVRRFTATGPELVAIQSKFGKINPSVDRLVELLKDAKLSNKELRAEIDKLPPKIKTQVEARLNLTVPKVTVQKVVADVLSVGGPITEHAAGGPVLPLKPYLVGEKGPELRIFTKPGYIIPNDQLAATAAAAGGSSVPVQPRLAPRGGDTYWQVTYHAARGERPESLIKHLRREKFLHGE